MSESQKTPFAVSINNFVEQKTLAYQQLLGQSYPARVLSVDPINSIVTINFEVDTGSTITLPPITCPIIGSQYIRIPIQVGDFGICISASVDIGGITGLGTGTPFLSPASNLGSLVFVPIGNAFWDVKDLDSVVINSPNGIAIAKIGDTQIKLSFGTNAITINSVGITIDGNVVMNDNLLVLGSITGQDGFNITGTGGTAGTMNVNGDIITTGTITNNGVAVDSTHVHSGVDTGPSNTGTPV